MVQYECANLTQFEKSYATAHVTPYDVYDKILRR